MSGLILNIAAEEINVLTIHGNDVTIKAGNKTITTTLSIKEVNSLRVGVSDLINESTWWNEK